MIHIAGALMEKIQISDVTLREYGQNIPGDRLYLFTPEKRTSIAKGLIAAGFKDIELFSCINPKLAPAMEEKTLRRISTNIGKVKGVHFITLVPNRIGYDIFKRLNLGADGLDHTMGMFFSAVESHNRVNLGRSIEETLNEYSSISSEAALSGTRISAYISAAFGYSHPKNGSLSKPDPRTICEFIDRLFGMGAITVTLTDLQGIAGEEETRRLIESVLKRRHGRDVEKLGYHPHHISNAKALANSKAAFNAGIRRFDASLGGVGGCITGAPGNQPTEGLLDLFDKLGVSTDLDSEKVHILAKSIQRQIYDKINIEMSRGF
jgi:hydroxymethylglutaryl-CoA lyase